MPDPAILHQRGASLTEIARATGMAPEEVRDHLASAGLIPPPPINASALDAIADAVEAGQPIPAEARQWLIQRPWNR